MRCQMFMFQMKILIGTDVVTEDRRQVAHQTSLRKFANGTMKRIFLFHYRELGCICLKEQAKTDPHQFSTLFTRYVLNGWNHSAYF